jgi:peptide/nickel transport system substrate-binding protein
MVNSSLNLSPLGSGPYRFKAFEVEEGAIIGVELTPNQDFYKKVPFIERVIFRYFPDADTAISAYEQTHADETLPPEERISGISQITNTTLERAFLQTGLNIYTGLMPRLGMIFINLKNQDVPALQELPVRQALFLGTNRQRMIDQILQGQAIMANGPIFPASWAYYENLPQYAYEPETAIEMLKEAGYIIPAEGGSVREKDGERLEFSLVFPDSFPYNEIAIFLAEDWSKIGVKVDLIPVTEEELVEKYLVSRNFQLALVEINGMRFPDPDPYPFWHQTQAVRGQNNSGWDDRQGSEYLEQARTQIDAQTRQDLYQNFQIRFMSQLPSLPLFYPVYSYGVSDQVQGVRIGPIYQYSNRLDYINEWYIFTQANKIISQPTGTILP